MTAPIAKTATWTPPPAKTRKEIAEDLAASQQAAAALPGLQEKAAQEETHRRALEQWEKPFRERRAAAIAQARDLANRVREEETILKRHIAAELESPMMRSARSLIHIADYRAKMRDQVIAALKADFDRAFEEVTEDGTEASMMRAKSIAAATVSEDKIAKLLQEIDPGWSPVRGLVGPERDVAELVMGLLWPRDLERQKPDSGGKR